MPGLKLTALLAALTLAGTANAQSVERLDPALDQLVGANAQLTMVYQQYDGFFEGPTWVASRRPQLVFSDIPGNRLLAVDPAGKVSTLLPNVLKGVPRNVLHDSLYSNRDLVGSNGTALAKSGRLIMAMFGADTLTELDLTSRRERVLTTGASSPNFTRPNDLAIARNGDIWFSGEQGLFRFHAGQITLMRVMAANGLAFSPDQKFLYVTDGPTKIQKLAINRDGSVGKVALFIDTQGDPAKGEFVDGLKVDKRGNIWAVAPGGIWIIGSDGRRLGRILAPKVRTPMGSAQRFTNLAFGGRDGRTLFLTGPGAVYKIALVSAAYSTRR